MFWLRSTVPDSPVMSAPTRLCTFYIVFHKDLLADNTSEYTKEELKQRFVWVSVNESIPKHVPEELSDIPLIEEHTFPNYEPSLQRDHYYQNSVFFHLFRNPSYLTSAYVGFGQYDMEFKKETFDKTLSVLQTSPNIVVSFFTMPFHECPHILSMESWVEMFLKPYNIFKKTKHTLYEISKYPLCLYHTFILPRWFFVEMMLFTSWKMPTILRFLNNNNRHLAGTLERLFAFYISCGLHEKRITLYEGEGIIHHETQRLSDSYRGIIGRS